MKVLFSLILFAIVILSVMLIGETAARLWGPEGKYNKLKRTCSDVQVREMSEEFHHNLKPNVKAVMFRGEESLPAIPFEINSLGIRGADWNNIGHKVISDILYEELFVKLGHTGKLLFRMPFTAPLSGNERS